MITKGIIIKTPTGGNNKYLVRIPIFESANNTGSEFITYEASVCTSPGTYNGLQKGDCVFISFEDNRYSKPVILGKLFVDVNLNNNAMVAPQVLKVAEKAELPVNTTIGGTALYDIVNKLQDLEFFTSEDLPEMLKQNTSSDTPSETTRAIKYLYRGDGFAVYPNQPLTGSGLTFGELVGYSLIFMRCYFADGNWSGNSFCVYFTPSVFVNNPYDVFSCPIVMVGDNNVYIRDYGMKFFMQGGQLFAALATLNNGTCEKFNIVEIMGVR